MSSAKKIFYVIIFLVFASFLILFLFYPQYFYFDQEYQFKRYRIYFLTKTKISDQMQKKLSILLNKTDSLLKKSEIFDPALSFKVFIRSNGEAIFNLPYQFNTEAYAQTIPFFHNIFVWNANLLKNEVFIPSSHHRLLSAVLAHEMVHVLYEKHFGWRKVKFYNWLDRNEKTRDGFIWKEEGYAEYIAGGSGIGLKEGLQILGGTSNSRYGPIEVEYFKFWLAIKYLIEKKHLTLDQIVCNR